MIASPGITYAGVIFDSVGNLYGVTYTGGIVNTDCPQGCGTIFELSPVGNGTWTQTTIYSFQGPTDGAAPYGGLVFDSAGNLYGANEAGGTFNNGVVYELSPTNGSWNLTTLFAFPAGIDPTSSLVLDQQGNLYGVGFAGGQYGGGTVYRVAKVSGGWQGTVLHSFGGPNDGARPNSPLVIDAQGNVYGTTYAAGANDYGNLFELSRTSGGSWTENIIYNFTEGQSPQAGLIFDSAHNLYGTTRTGGTHGAGTVFRFTRISQNGQLVWKHILLYSFTAGADGSNPAAPLVMDSSGNLYGTTDGAQPAGCTGSSGCGQVFKLTVNGIGQWNIAALYPIPNFFDPNGALVLDSANNIYGTAIDSQTLAVGDVFEVTQ